MRTRRDRRAGQQGFSVLFVMGIVVMVGAVVAYATSVTNTLHAGVAQEIAAARALQAARAGLEWGRFVIAKSQLCAPSTSFTIAFSSGAFPVTVSCVVTSPVGGFNEAGAVITTYQLTSTACRPAPSGLCPDATLTQHYVQSQITGIAEYPPPVVLPP